MAKFELNRKGKPRKDGDSYSMKLWMENVPVDTTAIGFNFNHESIEEGYEYEEAQNDGTGFSTEIELYGNVQIRTMIWSRNQGVGYVDTLYNALVNYYHTVKTTRDIEAALNDIRDN